MFSDASSTLAASTTSSSLRDAAPPASHGRVYMRPHVFLIPGYLGFRGKQGYSGYWDSVEPILTEHGFTCHTVMTEPVAIVARRARTLRNTIIAACGDDGSDAPIHLVGHSMGGLDARYLLSPGTSIRLPDALRARVRTVASIATPHHGTPIADFYQSLRAEEMLGFVGKVAARWSTDGRLDQASKFIKEQRRYIDRVLSKAGREEFARILQGVAEADADDYSELRAYLASLAKHRGALRRLRVRYMARFNDRVMDDPDMRYVSFVSGAEAVRVRDVGTWLYRLGTFIAGGGGRVALPPLPNGGVVPAERVVSVFHEPGADKTMILSPKLSDGVVPSASQFWGEFGGYVPLDHHAVIGRFDLLPAREPDLHELYSRVAEELLTADTPSTAD